MSSLNPGDYSLKNLKKSLQHANKKLKTSFPYKSKDKKFHLFFLFSFDRLKEGKWEIWIYCSN